ncbi:hypothetical protein CYMTET_20576 [Cymbomonas tetramitiformis]|uniref:Uncharacterized protein n=1 Tax=Cymbomonas tetramitiformis TaxID=36881 RepID=A0AAE0L445_9CHLO|nr:hypothetical protein CYMTET_20576 [Cymbomonas tetramitiformis]
MAKLAVEQGTEYTDFVKTCTGVNMAPDPVDAEDAIDTNHVELEELDDSVFQAIQSSPETALYEGVAHADVRNEVEQEVLDNIDMPISFQAPEDPAPIAPVATPNMTSVYLENLQEAVLFRCALQWDNPWCVLYI